ncbi:hypothetical protein ACX9MO_15340 [Pseudooceanicola sp. 502str34]
MGSHRDSLLAAASAASAATTDMIGHAGWQCPLAWFHRLWDDLNDKRGFGWQANPWVAVNTFTIHLCNVDRMEDTP